MSLTKIPYEINLKATVIFLNMFGLKLSEAKEKSGKEISILDKDNKVVGSIIMLEDSININAISDIGQVFASYKPAVASLAIDTEVKSMPRSADWKADIRYEINKNASEIIKGMCLISFAMDEEMGTNCTVSHSLRYFLESKEIMTLQMLLGSTLFSLNYYNGDMAEDIIIAPNSLNAGYVWHDLKWGQYVSGMGYPRRVYTSIRDYSPEEKNKLGLLYYDSEYGDIKDDRFLAIAKKDYDSIHNINGKGHILQLGELIKENDPYLYERINELRSTLTSGDVSLLDNLISVSLEGYPDDVIEGLFGIKKDPLKYNGQLRNLKNTHIGIDELFKLSDGEEN